MTQPLDYLSIDDLIDIGEAVISDFRIRDLGALQSACARPQISVFTKDAYPDFNDKVAALMHSLARNHGLIDGNKRLAWSAARIFCLMNDYDLNLDVDSAERLVISVATGEIDVTELSNRLKFAITEN